MSRRKEETVEALRQMLKVYEALPESIADKICFDMNMHRAETLDELRAVTDALPSLNYRPSNMDGDVDCLNASLCQGVRLHLFHYRVLNDQCVRKPADLSLLKRESEGVA